MARTGGAHRIDVEEDLIRPRMQETSVAEKNHHLWTPCMSLSSSYCISGSRYSSDGTLHCSCITACKPTRQQNPACGERGTVDRPISLVS